MPTFSESDQRVKLKLYYVTHSIKITNLKVWNVLDVFPFSWKKHTSMIFFYDVGFCDSLRVFLRQGVFKHRSIWNFMHESSWPLPNYPKHVAQWRAWERSCSNFFFLSIYRIGGMWGCSWYLQCVLRVVPDEEHRVSQGERASQDVPDEKHCVPNEVLISSMFLMSSTLFLSVFLMSSNTLYLSVFLMSSST